MRKPDMRLSHCIGRFYRLIGKIVLTIGFVAGNVALYGKDSADEDY